MDPGPSGTPNELAGLPSVTLRSVDDIEREVVASYEVKREENEGEGGIYEGPTEFDRLMAVPDAIRIGDLTPFEVKQEQRVFTGEMIPSLSRESTEKNYNEEEAEVSDDEYQPEVEDGQIEDDDDSDWVDEDSREYSEEKKKKRSKGRKTDGKVKLDLDDGDDEAFKERIRLYKASEEFRKLQDGRGGVHAERDEEAEHVVREGFVVSESMWKKLYKYQRTGIRWMCELDEQNTGGILADEMGLGKTIQVIGLLRTLAESRRKEEMLGMTGLGPVLLVCPATVMHQWVREFRVWFPLCRVAVMHSSGAYRGANRHLVAKLTITMRHGSVLVTSYSTFYNERSILTKQRWHYVILDEGHKIRNPDARVTLALKEVRTPHRLILSGTPMQNNLKELWSLVDFVFPGRLGGLDVFSQKFAVPITQGGYANATEVQTVTAYKCALVLRDAINPYFLRRMKRDVQMSIELPEKSEQVLFCDICPAQRRLYKEYLASREVHRILSKGLLPFAGLMLLRKICNHPDLVTGDPNRNGEYDLVDRPDMMCGWPARSGKMQVVRSLLQLWHPVGHKVLLFSQSRRMLDFLEEMLILDQYSYLRMDGTTNIAKRQNIVHAFNSDPSVFVFLLTTRVGGVGVNLTSANKVIIFDPDWNPSTDSQANERAWRIGQKNEVTVYRLISTGTIEEKIYHRQIFKQFLANRVLRDPKQRRFFKTNDLHELFTLSESNDNTTYTGAIFSGETVEMTRENYFDLTEKERNRERKERKKGKAEEVEEVEEEEEEEQGIDEEKRRLLRKIAKRISKDLSLLSVKPKKKEKEGKERKHERKRRSDSLVEKDYDIPYLVRQKKQRKDKEDKHEKASDDFVLGELLEKTGVRSILRHDDVMGNKTVKRDEKLIEREADEVAAQAAASIRSRPKFNFLRSQGFVDETSNGQQEEGEGDDLLTRLRARKHHNTGDPQIAPALPAADRFVQLAEKVQEFLRKTGGSAKTEKIIEQFKKSIRPHEQVQFRSILKKICTFDERSRKWTLKDDFD